MVLPAMLLVILLLAPFSLCFFVCLFVLECILTSIISAEDSHLIFFIRVMLSPDFQIFFVTILFLNINYHFNLNPRFNY